MQTPLTNNTKETYCSLFKNARRRLLKLTKNDKKYETRETNPSYLTKKKRTKSTIDLTKHNLSNQKFVGLKKDKTQNVSTNYTNSCNKVGVDNKSGGDSKLKANHNCYYKYKSITRICYDEYLFSSRSPDQKKKKNLKINILDSGKKNILDSLKNLGEMREEKEEEEGGVSFVEESFTSDSENSSLTSQSESSFTSSENSIESKGSIADRMSQFTSSSSSIASLLTIEAQGDTKSILSFLILKEGKERHKACIDSPKSHGIGEEGPESQLQGRSCLNKELDFEGAKSFNLECQICQKRVFNGQEVACFSICEHYMHEFCLIELINRKCFKFDCGDERQPLFCPKCCSI